MFDFLDDTARDLGGLFAGRDHSAPTAESPQQCAPEDAGPLGMLGQFGQTVGDFGRGLSQEGLSGLLDPSGMLDRMDAQRDLADRFDIRSPEDMVSLPGDAGAENVVSPEEFQRIARTYSDVRMGRSDINFNTEGLDDDAAAAYRDGSMNDLASIMQTSGGRTLIDRLAYQPDDRTTTLSPLFGTNAAGDYDPASGLDNTNGYAEPEGSAGEEYRVDASTPGVGTNSRVRINPGESIAPADADLSQDEWLPWRSDALLYHELVHSMDHVYGTMDPSTAGADGDGVAYDENVDRAEHRAAGLGIYANEAISENAYRAARRGIGASGIGAREGDVDMADRDTYFYHGLPAPAPGGGSPGTTPRDPHGHGHHHH